MPIPVTKYTCEYRCGKRAASSEKDMARHEAFCWKNPENKTCKTCKNEIYSTDYGDMGDKILYRGCKLPHLSDVLESCQEIMSSQNALHVRPVYKCPYWNKKPDDDLANFAELLSEEIKGAQEGTEHYPFYNKPIKEVVSTDGKDLFGNNKE